MFEGWAADVLASYLGKYLDLPRDRLRISLWGGEGILEDVQLRVEAFEYLQLPFVIKEGSVGRLKLQIPWGRWRGGPLVVELSDVVLCVAPREESDWEEGPALRRAQAAKQAQLAAAELAKLGSRVAATGSSSGGGAKPGATAPAAAGAGGGTSWGWVIADYVLSFLLNRLQFAVKNIHVYFQAPDSCSSEYEAFGVKLASLSTVAAGDTPSVLSLFPALQSVSAAAAAAVKVVRQLHVQGWSCYWKPRRQQQQQTRPQQPPAPQGQPAASTSGQQHRPRHQHRHAAAPIVAAQDYLLAPVEAVLQVTVHTSSAGSAGGTGGKDSSSTAGVLSSGLACDVFLGAGQVGMQLSSQQLVGMARLADDAAVWSKRARYGCYRPPGWITVQQAAQQGLCWHDSWHESRSRQQPEQQEQGEPAAGPSKLPRTASSNSSSSTSSADTGVEELIRSASFSSAAGSCLVPTGRNGVGAPVTWRAVWQYAVHSVLADLRDRRRQQGCWSVQKSDLLARRRYVHLYQQKLDALQPKATAAAADSSTDSTADSKAAEGSTAAAVPAAAAAAAVADGSSTSESSAALQVELQRLEQQLCVEDILLCRSLAELALERRSSSSDAERCRSWFAWGASSIAGYLYPSAQQASTHSSSTTPSKAPTPSKQSLSSGGAGASMPSEADLDELLEILHIRNNSDAGGGAAPREEAAAALEAAQQAAGGRAAPAPDGKPGGLAATALIGLKWQVLRLRAALQDCPAAGATRELLVLDVEGTSITGSLKGGNLSAQLAVQDVRLFDCCSDPGVHECVLQRLDPASPVSAVAGQLLSPSRGWGSGLTGLGLSQAQGLQRMSPEAFGWSGNAMPAVASGAHMRRVAGAPGGASADGRGSGPALLTIGVEFAGSSKGVSVQLEPLQLLLRPGCLVAVNSMLEQLPQDTLQQQLAAAHAEFKAGSGQHACSRPAGAAAPSTAAAASAAGPRSVRFSDNTWEQPQEGTSKAAAPGRPQQLPPALLQLQLTFVVSELLLVLPTELHYAAGTNAVLHLQGLKLAAVQGAAAGPPLGSVTPPTHQPHPALSSTSSDGAAQPGSGKPRQLLLLQQQLTLGLTSLFVGLQQPCLSPAWRHSFNAEQPEHTPHQQQQSRLLELLKLPPVQGTMWLTGSSQAAPSQRRLSTETPSTQALVKVSLQVPPVSCCLSASMLAALQQAAAVLAWQSQLGLPELVATYHLPLQQQLGMAHSASQQPQEQPPQPQKPGAPTATQAAAAVDAAAAECASSRTPSPTESEVAEWLAAAAPALPSSHTDPDAAAATATQQQLRRCDSDKLLPPAAGHSCDRQQQQAAGLPAASSRARNTHEKQQRVQLSQADAAALLAAPDVLLLDLEVLLEELDIQYIHDAAGDAHAQPQHEPQQPASSPQRASELGTAGSHLRLQASLLSVGFKHSTHGRRAEAGLKDLVLQAGAATGGEEAQRAAGGGPLPGLLQLISSVSVEEVQVAWGWQLGPLAVLQEVQLALEGLQIQGQPGDVGLFLLPASADVGSSITAAVHTSTPHAGAAASSSLPGPSKGTTAATPPAAASTYVVVGLQNLALGIDGLLHLVAAAAGPKSSSKSSTTNSKAGAASPTQQQQGEQPPTAGSHGAKTMLTLEVELSQIQLLSCCSSAGVSPPRWQAADSLTQAWQPLQDAAATATPHGGGVACELLLDVPAATFSLQPCEQPPPQQQQQQQLIPRLMLQDLALYLPGAPGADLLLPVLHIPRVLLTGGAEAGQQEQQQEQSGFAAVLAQQAECHRLLVPAVASSWRPPQLQHLVQFVGRQEQQWQSWTAAASGSSRAADAAQATRPTEQDGGQAQQGAAGGRSAAGAQRQQELSVEVGDVQLLLLPADGTCDKGLLLHWQQLQAVVLQHPQQQQQQPSNRDAPAGQATDQGVRNASVLQRTKVTWQDLTVSAIQQDDMQQPLDSATTQQPQQHFAPEDSGQFGTPPGQHSRSPGLQQAVYWAHDLPAVAWLSQGLSSTGRQQGASARHRQSSHASNAGAAAAAAAAAAAGQAAGSNTLNSHATLSRFLSAQESWWDAASLASSVDGGSGFHTPNASGSLRSASSWITARSSSLSAALSLQAQQQQQRQPQQQQQPLRQHTDAPGGVAAAAAAALGPGSNIIAAWWQAEPSGQSPSGLSPSSVLPGWGSQQQPPQQQHPSWSGYASTEQEQQPQAGGRSPPPGRKGVRRSSSFRRGLPMGALQLVGRVGQQQQQERGAPSVRSSLNIAPSVHSQGQGQHDDGLTDAELEFYSIAGDSEQDEEREQQLSGLGGSPHSWGLGAGLGAAEEQDAWLHGWDLLPLAGFASRGCQVAASWLLLSLSAVGAAAGTDGSPAAVPQQHPALTLNVWQDMLSSQQAPRGQPVQRQVTDVSLAGLQLQLSSKHWDLVAPCILQAANTAAARPVVTAPQTVRRAAPRQQQLPQGRLSQLHLGLQELQVLLFMSPDAFPDAPLQQPRVLLMCSSSSGSGAHRDGHSGRGLGGGVQAGQSRRTSSEGFGPWQDPGSEPTTPNAAAGLGSGQAQHVVLPVGAGSSSSTSHMLGCAAQTVTLKLSVELNMQLPAADRPASLQQLHVPTACVQLGAAPWDAASGRVCAGTVVPGPATQQEQLLLLLAQGMRVTAGSPAGGLLPGAGLGQHLQVCVSSVSGWVSTTRLTLLLNIQQQLMQQLPALNAAAAMAGPSSNAYAAAAAAGGSAPGYISRTELPAATSLTSSASLMNGHAVVSSSVSMRRRSMEQQQSAGPRLVLDSSIAVAVSKVAILVSTDEPEPWLLQQQQQLSPGRANGSPVSCGLAAQAAGSARSPGTWSAFGSLAAPTGYAPLSTCSTPLVEVALLPLDVRLQLLKPCGSRRQGAAGQTVVQVDVTARLRADVYSVDKLGWEPVLDPWAFKVGVRLTPSAAASSAASGTRTTASISSSDVLELTAAPSCIIASKQLQALAAAAKTWQGEQALMQQLLQHLAAPAAGSASVSAAGAACWLVNETGAPLSYVVADAVMEPAAATAALGTCASSASSASAASSPVKPPLSQHPSAAARPGASARGQATHLTPVPLRVLDVAAAGYFGRFVQQGGVSDAAFELRPLQPGQAVSQAAASDSSGPAGAAAGAAAAAGSSGVKQSQLLYVQAAGRVEVVGPVALSQMGCSVHPLRALAAGGVLSPSTTPGHGSRRSRQASSLVVEVSRHRYGGRLVSVHSNIQLVNSSGLTLQLGYLSPMALTAQPLPLAVLAPGGSVWLPLQVLQATTPSLCLKPAGLPCGYSWCRALDVYALLPGPSSAPATSGFWYEPAGGRTSAPSSTPQYLTFTAEPPSSDGTGGSASPQQADAASASAAAAAAVGSLVLSVGASVRPWPAGVAVHDATSTGVSHGGSIYSRTRSAAGGGGHGSSAASSLWQLVVEPPAVLVNQLPVGVEVSVVAGKGEVRGLAALIDSRQQLPLYGCEAAYYSKLRVQVPGFHSSSWVPLNAAFASPRVSSSTGGSAAATAARHLSDPGIGPWHGGSSSSSSGPGEGPAGLSAGGAGAPRQSDVGGAVHPGADPGGGTAAVPDVLQLLDQHQVVLSALPAHQAPQVLQLRTCRNKLTGCLTVTVSCSLWIFNCLGSQIAIRQVGPAAESGGRTTPGVGLASSTASPLPAAAAPAAAIGSVSSMGISHGNSSSSSSQVLWLPPYPWMSPSQGSGSSSDLVGLVTAAAGAGAGAYELPSLAAAWAAARRSDASGGGSSRSALQRSRSTPSLLASTAGLEFLAATPAQGHAAVARGTGPSSAGRPTGAPAHQCRASRAEQQQQHSQGLGLAAVSTAAAAAPAGALGPSPFAAAASGPTSLAANSAGGSGGLPPTWPQQQQHEQRPPLQLPVRRSFSASAQLQLNSPGGSIELEGQTADAGAHSSFQQAPEITAAGTDGGGAATGPGLPRAVRTRRHSSGLHMLASGKLPQQLLPPLQVPESSAGPPAGCSSYDLLSPTHQQRLLQQMHFQQAAAAAGSTAQLPQYASARDLAAPPASGNSLTAIVLPLMKPDMSGWLPFLAGGDLSQLTAAAAAFAGPVSTAEVIVAPPPASSTVLTAAATSQAVMQQRVAAAAAAADQLLADMLGTQQQRYGQQPTEQALRKFGSPPGSVSQFATHQGDGVRRADGLPLGRPPSLSGYSHYGQQYSQYSASAGGTQVSAVSGPGLAGLAVHQGAAGSVYQMPLGPPQGMSRRGAGSWSIGGFADLAAAAAVAAPNVAGSSSELAYSGLPGSVGGGVSAVPPSYAASFRSPGAAAGDAASSASSAAASAAPVMCGWPVHMLDGGGGSSAPAGSRSGAAGPAMAAAAAAAAGSACGFVELQLCAAPAAVAAAMMGKGVQQLPAQWSLPARVPLLGSQSSPGPCSIVKLPLSVPVSGAAAGGAAGATGSAGAVPLSGGGTAGVGAQGEAVPAAVRRRASTRGRAAAGASGQQEQGACFVSVHTAAIPGGGGAWAVHLLPTYVLVNTLSTEVQLRQYDSELVLQTVAPGGHCCVLWPNGGLPLKLQFRVDEPGWSWSGAASVDAPGEFLVKIRHRSRGETLLLQLDVAASSSGIVATLSGRQGGFAPYRIDNCSAEVLHVQQAGCAEQEDVLRPYSSLPYAWDEPSMPHKVLLFLRGHRPLGEFALERVGQVRRVAIPSSSRDHLSRSHTKRLLLITTYAEGPMRVLRVLDTHSHLLQQPLPPAAGAGYAAVAAPGSTGLEDFSSRGSFASITDAPSANGSSAALSQQQGLSRPSSSSSLQGAAAAAAAASGSQSARPAPTASGATASAGAALAGVNTSQQLTARNRTLQLLSAFLAAPDSADGPATAAVAAAAASAAVGGGSSGGALRIVAPTLDVRLNLDGCGLSLVSDSRELLYSSVRGVRLRFCQDALRNAVGAAVASMRVENTLYGCQYPLMLASPVSRSVFGVVYPPGPSSSSSSTARALPAAAAAAADDDDDDDADAADEAGGVAVCHTAAAASSSVAAGADALTDSSVAAAAASVAAASAAIDAVGMDAQSIAHAVADELQQQEQLAHQASPEVSPSKPGTAATLPSRQPSRSGSTRYKLQQLQPQQQQQQQAHVHALQVLQPHHLALGVLATVWRTQPSGVVCVEQLGLQLSPLALSLEGKHLKQLMEFGAQVAAAAADASEGPAAALLTAKGRGQAAGLAALGLSSSGSVSGAGGVAAAYAGVALQQSWPPVQPPTLPAAATSAVRRRLKLYFEEWFISAITLCISFAPGSWFDPSPAGLASAWSGSAGSAAAAAVAAAAAAAAAQAASDAAAGGPSSEAGAESTQEPSAAQQSDSGVPLSQAEQGGSGAAGGQQEGTAADAGAAAAAVAAASSSPLPVYLQMALALAHAEEGAWLTLAPFSSTHTMINTESLVQVLGRHYILAAYQELPKVLASLDIFGDPARLLQALGLGFWNLVTLPAHSARWGPYRSLQRLLRGMRVMAYGVSNSIAKGSKRSKAALLPLAPDGLTWQQQQHTQQGGGWGGADGSAAMHRPGLETGSMVALRSGSIQSAADAAAAAGGSSSGGSNQPGSGQDLLHVLVAGYSLTFQQLLRSFQSGQPLRGVVRAAAQTLVLPALLLLETSESTASSFVRLLAEQVPGAVALRVPRYVASGQLLRPYDRLESLGRALLHHTPGPFLREEFLGCVELQQGLYAVVTVGHLLLLACHTSAAVGATASSDAGTAAGSSKAGPPGLQQQQQQPGEQLPAREQDAAGAAASDSSQQRRQQRVGCVQYKDPQLVFVLDLRDVMMVAAEGSSLRLLCMAGDPAASSAVADGVARQQAGAAAAAAAADAAGVQHGSGSSHEAGAEDGEGGLVSRQGSGSAKGGDAGSTSGLRELLTVGGGLGTRSSGLGALVGLGRLQQRLPSALPAGSGGSGVPTAAAGVQAGVQAGVDGSVGSGRGGRWQTALGSIARSSMTDAEFESAAVGAAAAVAAAVGGGLMGVDRHSLVLHGQGGGEDDAGGAAAQQSVWWGGCKWFVGHQVPCGSDGAALQLQQLLERACQRVETLLASSAWPRQLML